MRRIIMLAWIVGCSTDEGNDGDLSTNDPPDVVDPDAAEKDREECKLENAATRCPPSWGWSVRSGAADDGELVELEAVAEPVCGDRGLFAEPDDFVGAPAGPEVTMVRNSQCTIVCFPQCSFTSVCYAKNPDGRPCGHACSAPDLTEDECASFVAECLGDAGACRD